MNFPATRLRRVRQNPRLREMLAEVRLDPKRLMLPLFVRSGKNQRQPIPSLPGHSQLSADQAAQVASEAHQEGVGGVLLFGIPTHKDSEGSASWQPDGVVQQAIAAIKELSPEVLVATDLCFCEYTDHGHCGVLAKHGDRVDVDNDATLEILAKQAISHAQAGAELIAPSGMMDGMVGAIRGGLDQGGYSRVPILSYAVKYASAFYGPFRDAAESTPQAGDRRGYQMDPLASAETAIREVELDLQEGADMIMVKPALAYLDIVRLVRERFPGVPLAAYNVSGEFSAIKAAAAKGWLDERATAMELLSGIHRAGASLIITYWARDVARWLEKSA